MRVALEGLIGAGKSTLLRQLNGSEEAVNEWGPLLKRFYENPERWAFALQMQVLLTQGEMAEGLTERSPHSALHVFARGSLTAHEWSLLEAWTERHGWVPDAVVFLRASPSVCLERIRSRAREGEEGITLEYLLELQRAYDDYLAACSEQGIPVHVVDHDDPKMTETVASVRAV